MHEIQRLISTDLRNIYNWTKDEGVLNLKCSRARVARRLLTKCLFKTNKQALNQNLFLDSMEIINKKIVKNFNQI